MPLVASVVAFRPAAPPIHAGIRIAFPHRRRAKHAPRQIRGCRNLCESALLLPIKANRGYPLFKCYGARMRIIGLAGWSGSGKTTLLTKVIPRLVGRRPK